MVACAVVVDDIAVGTYLNGVPYCTLGKFVVADGCGAEKFFNYALLLVGYFKCYIYY